MKPDVIRLRWVVLALALSGVGAVAHAHFVVLLPARDVASADDPKDLPIELLFTHPMEQGPIMEMARPRQFGVLSEGKKIDLLETLQRVPRDGKSTYRTTCRLTRPGDHVFYVEPAPYWEPSERKLIIHYTKVVVDFMGAEEGWDAMVGFPVEIAPLVRPYGLWTGNSFRGIVKKKGRPVPFATVEVEYDNVGRKVRVPNDAFVTQVIKADAQGVFCYTMPRAGWWGFAALLPGDEKMKNPAGEPVDVELGGLIWVRTVDMDGPREKAAP